MLPRAARQASSSSHAAVSGCPTPSSSAYARDTPISRGALASINSVISISTTPHFTGTIPITAWQAGVPSTPQATPICRDALVCRMDFDDLRASGHRPNSCSVTIPSSQHERVPHSRCLEQPLPRADVKRLLNCTDELVNHPTEPTSSLRPAFRRHKPPGVVPDGHSGADRRAPSMVTIRTKQDHHSGGGAYPCGSPGPADGEGRFGDTRTNRNPSIQSTVSIPSIAVGAGCTSDRSNAHPERPC